MVVSDPGVVDAVEDVVMLKRDVEYLDCDVPENVDAVKDVVMLKRDVEYPDCDVPKNVDDNCTVLVEVQDPKETDISTAAQMLWANFMVAA